MIEQLQQMLLAYNPKIILLIGIGLIISSISFYLIIQKYIVTQPFGSRLMLTLAALAEFVIGCYLVAFGCGFKF